MKKVLAISLALVLLLGLAAVASASTTVGANISDWRVSLDSEASFEAVEGGLLLKNPAKANVMASVNLIEAVDIDGLEFTITPTMWSMGHWIAFTLTNKANGQSGATDVPSFGKGLMVICQYVSSMDYMCVIPYSINENGFAVGDCDIGVIGSEFMYSTESITVGFEQDDDLGYVMLINGREVVTADGGSPIDMSRLTVDFPDGKAYLGFSMLNGNGTDVDTLLIENIVNGGAEPEPESSVPASSADDSKSSGNKGGCGNNA